MLFKTGIEETNIIVLAVCGCVRDPPDQLNSTFNSCLFAFNMIKRKTAFTLVFPSRDSLIALRVSLGLGEFIKYNLQYLINIRNLICSMS
jgi:hypothetical protein